MAFESYCVKTDKYLEYSRHKKTARRRLLVVAWIRHPPFAFPYPAQLHHCYLVDVNLGGFFLPGTFLLAAN